MKLTVIIQNGTLAGKKTDLTEGFLTVGRAQGSGIAFDANAENMVSTKHAYFETKADGFYLIDNKSTNGTFVNGQHIQIAKLNSGDTIQFGKNGPQAKILIEQPAFQAQPAPTQFVPQNQAANSAPPAQIQPPPNFRNSLNYVGLNNPQIKPEAEKKNYLGAAAVIFGIVFLSLIVMLIMFSSIGIVAAVIGSFVAFIPALFYILPLIWLDRYDPEPAWLLALAFAWGALVAVIVSFIFNTAFGAFFGGGASAVISAPVIEEGSKGLGLLILLVFFRREFDDILDGIIYAGVIALGFATVENVLYYGRGVLEGGSNALMLLFIVRGIMSPFAHVTFTAMTGIGCGISRESHNSAVKFLLPILGYISAVVLHALWNGMAMLGGLQGFIVGYIVLEIPFFLLFVGFAFYVMRRQNKILREMLAMDTARGLITQEQLDTVTSAFKSSGWLLGGLFSGKFIARSRFIRAVGKLGLSYWHIQRATAAQGQTGSFQTNPLFRQEVADWRKQL